MKFRFDNMDASENVFFSRQLEQIRAQAFEVQYAALKGFDFVPAKTDFHPGVEDYTYRVFDKVGRAMLSSNGSDKGPRVDLKGFETTAKFKTLKDSYGYNIQEARNAMMAQMDLNGRKAKAARDAIMTLNDDAILLGANAPDSQLVGSGFTGLFTLSGTEVYAVPNGGTGSTLWTSKTPDEVVQDMHGMVFQVEQNSNEIEKCDTMILPLSRKGLVSSTRMGDGSNQTILTHFLETNGSIKRVEFSQKLNANTAWTGARAMAYKKDPEKLECLIAVAFEQLPPQYDGYEVLTHCQARVGGTICYFPKSVVYANNI